MDPGPASLSMVFLEICWIRVSDFLLPWLALNSYEDASKVINTVWWLGYCEVRGLREFPVCRTEGVSRNRRKRKRSCLKLCEWETGGAQEIFGKAELGTPDNSEMSVAPVMVGAVSYGDGWSTKEELMPHCFSSQLSLTPHFFQFFSGCNGPKDKASDLLAVRSFAAQSIVLSRNQHDSNSSSK